VESDDEDEELPPPTATRVARRSLVLAALCCRGFIDRGAGDPDAESLRNRLKVWLADSELTDEIEKEEAEIFALPLGALRPSQAISIAWEVEGLAIFAWALGKGTLPPWFSQVDPYATTDDIGLLAPNAIFDGSTTVLKPVGEIEAIREMYYAIHCRLCEYDRSPATRDIRHWFELSWAKLLGCQLPLGADGDLCIDGSTLHETSSDRRGECHSIVRSRHRATVWLVGEQGPGYWHVTADT
jgi:hypothetical protein